MKVVSLFALVLVLFVLFGEIGCNYQSPQLSLIQTSSQMTVSIPTPTYLPAGYSVSSTIPVNEDRISYEYSDGKDLIGYDVIWKAQGAPAHGIGESVWIGGNHGSGWLVSGGQTFDLYWNWVSGGGFYILKLTTSKQVPLTEIMKIAGSVTFQ
jgi:hypothetical protein